MSDISFFSRAPLGLRLSVSIATTFDDIGHGLAEPRSNAFQSRPTALIFYCVLRRANEH